MGVPYTLFVPCPRTCTPEVGGSHTFLPPTRECHVHVLEVLPGFSQILPAIGPPSD